MFGPTDGGVLCITGDIRPVVTLLPLYGDSCGRKWCFAWEPFREASATERRLL